ncbi:hypothetical protein AAH991_33750 [Microbispora sp. ZYX-F-249]|uniref:Uncharacterized protein n=1 Tax=Microbispora maris TaxID=3144104 RepID=A0ABV0AZ52_9ACTN
MSIHDRRRTPVAVPSALPAGRPAEPVAVSLTAAAHASKDRPQRRWGVRPRPVRLRMRRLLTL